MISTLMVAVVPVAVVLVASEWLWRKKLVKGERARKFIHILAGAWMAFWPFYLPFDGIFVLGACALTILVYSRMTRLFHAIYAVKRKTYGDILFAVAIMACALLSKTDWIFSVSILLLSLADGGAAVVGRFYGLNNTYHVFGYEQLRKSFAGSFAYIVLALLCVATGWVIGGQTVIESNIALTFVVLPFAAMIIENSMPFGLDNVATPVFATLLLNSLV